MLLRLLPAVLFTFLAAPALAHGGHGAADWHWHASDTSGFLMVVVLASLALWLSRKD
jgi:hypothetical protein